MDQGGRPESVVLPAPVCRQYVALSRFNSPYPAHDRGHAVDLYPAAGAPSPVAGEVVEHRAVRAPDRPHAETHDHLLVVDIGDHLARLLHVEPAVGVGDRVAVGDDLGRLVRSGYFAPWVDDHLHLGFRPRDADPIRATGSLPVALGVGVEPVPWDGTGTVVETGSTHAVLDAPAHPAPGEHFAGLAVDGDGADAGAHEDGAADEAGGGTGPALDGGLPHYDGAGLFEEQAVAGGGAPRRGGPVSLLGTAVGDAADGVVGWNDVEVSANGRPVTGLSLGARRDRLGAKLVSWDGPTAAVGERVEVAIVRR